MAISSGNITIGSGLVTANVSGQPVVATGGSGLPIWQTSSGVVGVVVLSGSSTNAVVSGSVQVSGTIEVSGRVSINSGLIAVLSGVVTSSGDTYTITNTGFQVSGTVAVSGKVFVAGQSGINLWTDASGVLGVTIISSNISIPATSGSVQVSGIVGVSGRVDVLSGEIHIMSGAITIISGGVFVSGTVTILNTGFQVSGTVAISGGVIVSGTVAISSVTSGSVQVSGTVSVSGEVTVSGTVFVLGQSGLTLPQMTSGTLVNTASGIVHGGLVAGVALCEPINVVRASGQPQFLRVDANGILIARFNVAQSVGVMSGLTAIQSGLIAVLSGSIGAQVSGAVQVSGILGVSGRVDILSGEIHIMSGAITIISGGVFVSGTVSLLSGGFVNSRALGISGIAFWQDASGVVGVTIISANITASTSVVSGSVQVSGTVSVSGKVFAAGMSGINYWQDASGVVGVTILSSNISVSTSVNSGLFVVVGSGNYMSGMGVVTSVSGNMLATLTPTQGRSRGNVPVSSASGGDILASGDCISITIRMLNKGSGGAVTQSGLILVGFDAAGERPYASSSGIAGYNSSYGFILTQGDAVTYNIDNMNRLRVYSMLSGEYISYTATMV